MYVTSRMHNAEDEGKNLKRTASREEPTPEAKRLCVDETVQKMMQLHKEQKLAAQRAAKNMVISRSRKDRGLAPAGEPMGAVLDSSLYFNWRGQGRCHRGPVEMD